MSTKPIVPPNSTTLDRGHWDVTFASAQLTPKIKKRPPELAALLFFELVDLFDLPSRGLRNARPLRAADARARSHVLLRAARPRPRSPYYPPCPRSCDADTRCVHAGDGQRRPPSSRQLLHCVPLRLSDRYRGQPERAGYRQLSC